VGEQDPTFLAQGEHRGGLQVVSHLDGGQRRRVEAQARGQQARRVVDLKLRDVHGGDGEGRDVQDARQAERGARDHGVQRGAYQQPSAVFAQQRDLFPRDAEHRATDILPPAREYHSCAIFLRAEREGHRALGVEADLFVGVAPEHPIATGEQIQHPIDLGRWDGDA
jgi:hypothetical protein